MAPVLSAIGAIAAAIVAGSFAYRVKNVEVQALRVRDLEARLASSKFEVYEPMLEYLRRTFAPSTAPQNARAQAQETRKSTETLTKFNIWIQMYGADDVVQAFHKFMQAAFHDAPPRILMRYYGEFLLAARKDLGDSETATSTGDRNELCEPFRWCHVSEGLARSSVEVPLDAAQIRGLTSRGVVDFRGGDPGWKSP